MTKPSWASYAPASHRYASEFSDWRPVRRRRRWPVYALASGFVAVLVFAIHCAL